MRHDLMPRHRPPHRFGDLREIDPPVHEGFDGDFVRGVQHSGQRPADFASLARQQQRGKAIRVGFFKRQAANLGEVGLDAINNFVALIDAQIDAPKDMKQSRVEMMDGKPVRCFIEG